MIARQQDRQLNPHKSIRNVKLCYKSFDKQKRLPTVMQFIINTFTYFKHYQTLFKALFIEFHLNTHNILPTTKISNQFKIII